MKKIVISSIVFLFALVSGAETFTNLTVVSNLVVGTGSATGERAVAEGSSTASGMNSHAEGSSTASGAAAHAEGAGTVASGIFSHAEGSGSIASTVSSHAEGGNTSATGLTSHAEGYYTIAGGLRSHAEGDSSEAHGETSHAEGYGTIADGDYSHSEGYATIAGGTASHAAGANALATNDYTFVWSDGTEIGSTDTNQFTVYASNGIRLLGGPIEGDGSGLTGLNAGEITSGTISASSLPSSGTWDASDMTVTLQDVIAELSTMTNVTLSGEALATVIDDLQQQLDDVYVANNSITVQVTDNEETNGAALLAAYADAKTMNPSSTNRIAVIVPPGRYNLSTNGLTMDTEYIDLIGLTTDRDVQYLYGLPGENNGVIKQTADYIHIENLCLYAPIQISFDISDPADYFPTIAGSNTVVRNCNFAGNAPTRTYIEYAGYYERCKGGLYLFNETASGMFIDCQADEMSFGRTASGTFIRCCGNWTENFGNITASGIFIDCQGGDWSFGPGVASGTFINCRGGGSCFGGEGAISTNAVLKNCTAGPNSFGAFNMAATDFSYNADGYHLYGGPISGDGSGLTNITADSITYIPAQGDLAMGVYTNGMH